MISTSNSATSADTAYTSIISTSTSTVAKTAASNPSIISYANTAIRSPIVDTNSSQSLQTPHVPSVSVHAVFCESAAIPDGTPQCRGHDFSSHPNDIESIIKSMLNTGFQATNLGLAVEQIRQMRQWRHSEPDDDNDSEATHAAKAANSHTPPRSRCRKYRARIFLAYTSNQMSCGQREVIRYLVQNRMIDVLITTAGGVEEDLIKILHPTYMGDFALSGKELRRQGINRIGNLLIPNQNYCAFEDWVSPIIHKMHDELDAETWKWINRVTTESTATVSATESIGERFAWTPSKVIERLGREINHPDSVLYWAAKNNIPVFCPALTDGSFGDMLYFHSYKRSSFFIDICADIRRLNDLAVRSHCTGQIILGGGLVKHHCCNANLMRNGADFSVYINTASDYDGSDSGASPDEAISWGKIRITAQPVKVTGDASILFPLIVSQTFARDVAAWQESIADTVCWSEEDD